MTEQKKKQAIIVGIAVVLILVLGGYFIFNRDGGQNSPNGEDGPARGVAGEPLDIALDYYNDWLAARAATDTDPVAAGLLASQSISQALENELTAKLADSANTVDPVLCQSELVTRQRVKTIFEKETSAQILIMPVSEARGSQATFSLSKNEMGNWAITSILCSSGEEAPPQGEFSFERDGFLLHNVPPPQNPQAWYLVFSEQDTPGHTVELLLDQDSTCIAQDGQESTCSYDQFGDAKPVFAQGEMTEAGLKVKRVTFK